MERTHIENTGGVKACPICGKPMELIKVKAPPGWLILWVHTPCIREGDKEQQKEAAK